MLIYTELINEKLKFYRPSWLYTVLILNNYLITHKYMTSNFSSSLILYSPSVKTNVLQLFSLLFLFQRK